jgi:hypothetical protein
MDLNDRSKNHFDLLQAAMRDADPGSSLGQAVARLKQPLVLGDGQKWYYEGFVSMLSAVRQTLATLDGSISPDLPPFLLEPATIARLFGIPLEDFNWQGYPTDNALAAQLARMEAKLDNLKRLNAEESVRDRPIAADSADLPDCLPSRIAAKLLGVDKKTLEKLRIDGFLKWRVKNPGSSRKEFLYEKRSVLELKNSYRVGDPRAARPKPRRKVVSNYVPQHIKLE